VVLPSKLLDVSAVVSDVKRVNVMSAVGGKVTPERINILAVGVRTHRNGSRGHLTVLRAYPKNHDHPT
jgi:hypothetical protein